MRLKKVGLLIVLVFSMWANLFAQHKKDSATPGFLVNMSYGGMLPGGDLAKRFGFTSDLQLGAYYRTTGNWLFGAQGGFIFGNQLRETGILDSIATKDLNLIANDGNYSQVKYFERGWDAELAAGKLFPLKKKNLNSGIMVMLGAGYIRHKIRIETPADWTPQAAGDYLQGYDRLTAGFCVTEYIGYQYMSKKRFVNFFAGFNFTQGFTKSLRYDFDLMSQNTKLRNDLLSGFRIGWILPILKKATNSFYMY